MRSTSEATAVATACGLVADAFNVSDDIIDADWPDDLPTWRRGVGAAMLLQHLAYVCLAGIAGVPVRETLYQIVTQDSITVNLGQDRDLQMEEQPYVTESQVMEVVVQSSGTLLALTCEAGALLATADPAIRQHIRDFGMHLGVVHKLLNDIGDLQSGQYADLRQRKKTILIAAALVEAVPEVRAWAQSTAPVTPEEARHLAQILRGTSAVPVALTLALAHRHAALAEAAELEPLIGLAAVQALAALVPTL
jgi:geranylgeranyl pyrophosphate synthase